MSTVMAPTRESLIFTRAVSFILEKKENHNQYKEIIYFSESPNKSCKAIKIGLTDQKNSTTGCRVEWHNIFEPQQGALQALWQFLTLVSADIGIMPFHLNRTQWKSVRLNEPLQSLLNFNTVFREFDFENNLQKTVYNFKNNFIL